MASKFTSKSFEYHCVLLHRFFFFVVVFIIFLFFFCFIFVYLFIISMLFLLCSFSDDYKEVREVAEKKLSILLGKKFSSLLIDPFGGGFSPCLDSPLLRSLLSRFILIYFAKQNKTKQNKTKLKLKENKNKNKKQKQKQKTKNKKTKKTQKKKQTKD